MRGIKKLVLALFFMTLICVGFKIDVKAADAAPIPTLKLEVNNGKIKGRLYFNDNKNTYFPNVTQATAVSQKASFVYVVNLKTPDDTIINKVINLSSVVNNVDPISAPPAVYVDNNLDSTSYDRGYYEFPELDIIEEVSKVSGGETKTGTFELYGSYSTNLSSTDVLIDNDHNPQSEDLVGDEKSITLGRVIVTVTDDKNKKIEGVKVYCGEQEVTKEGIYLYDKQEATFVVDEETLPSSKSYENEKWKDNNVDKSSGSSYTLTMDATAIEHTLQAIYKETNRGLTFSPDITTSTLVAVPTVRTDAISYTFTGYVNNSDDVQSVYMDGDVNKDLSPVWSGGSSTGTGNFSIIVPNGTSKGKHTLTVKMKSSAGGASYTKDFTVSDYDSIDLEDEVCVTDELSISLDTFLLDSSDASRSAYAELSGNAKSYAKINPDTGKISDIVIHGTNSMSDGKKPKLTLYDSTGTVEYDTANVTVYPWPEITSGFYATSSLNSSGTTTSSSNESPLVVRMPVGDYHGSIAWPNIKRGLLTFSGSRRSTTAYVDFTGSASNLLRTATINSSGLTNLLKEICSQSSEYVEIVVNPMNGSSVDELVYDDVLIRVHRISLDGSEGATYKVNDQDVGDYFYAVDGINYKITATNKSGYTSTIEKWEGVNFGTSTSGTASFTGSKTVKAFFKSSTSSSSSSSSARSSSSSSSGRTTAPSGGPGGDYDDVPKTGESKTDIWILWSVLFISILGAGFMIYKRFGLVKAIARAEEEAALVEREERVEAEKKEKKEKMDLLKSLRDL